MRYTLLIVCYSFLVAHVPHESTVATVMPRVFLIGDYEEEYDLLQEEYEISLLEICDNDMQLAYGKLISMFEEMEAYAEQIGYDVNGVRIWLHLFWGEDGTIEYLAFHPRPNSRKVENEELETFLLGFVHQYRFPLISTEKYTLYSSASFPTFSKRLQRN